MKRTKKIIFPTFPSKNRKNVLNEQSELRPLLFLCKCNLFVKYSGMEFERTHNVDCLKIPGVRQANKIRGSA